MEDLINWFSDPIYTKFGKYILVILVFSLGMRYFKRLFKKKIDNDKNRYTAQKSIEIFGYIMILLVTISFFTGALKDLTIAIGLFSAGVALTLQELILSIAGSFYIFIVRVYTPGDRIELNGIKGDVINIDSVYTTIMEIGQWVSSDNYSGRIVKISNAFVFKGPVFNYSADFPFVWDEITIPVRYGSDIAYAKSAFLEVANNLLKDFVADSKNKWSAVVDKYYIENATIEPTIAIQLTDNWINMNLRYIVDYKLRRLTRNDLHLAIHDRVNKSEGKIQLGSATFELVSLPPINVTS